MQLKIRAQALEKTYKRLKLDIEAHSRSTPTTPIYEKLKKFSATSPGLR